VKFLNSRLRRSLAAVAVAGAATLSIVALHPGAANAATTGSSIVSIAQRELNATSHNYEANSDGSHGTNNCTYYAGVMFTGWPTCGYTGDGVVYRGSTVSGNCNSGHSETCYAWCAAFAKYVWKQGGVTSYLSDITGMAASFKSYGQNHGTWHARGSYTPQPGDALVFDWEHDGVIDHVGIVTSVSGGTVYTIEGNSGDKVSAHSYSTTDTDIVGYTTAVGVTSGSQAGQYGDYSGDNIPDVVGYQTSTSNLIMYSTAGAGHTVTGATTIGSNWSNYDDIVRPGDFDGDGLPDILARNKTDHDLYFFKGRGATTPYSGVDISNNWSTMDQLSAPGDFDRDGNIDIIARNTSTGELVLFRGNGNGGFLGSTVIGTGWTVMSLIMSPGDFNGDGNPDILARRSDTNQLMFYPGNGATGFGSATQAGTGWGGIIALVGGGDVDNDGNNDVIAFDSATHNIILYTGNGAGGFKTAGSSTIGTNWSAYTTIF
jgi:hypothetical protein